MATLKQPGIPQDELIRAMLAGFKALGHDPMARIDARILFRRFSRQAAKLGIRAAIARRTSFRA